MGLDSTQRVVVLPEGDLADAAAASGTQLMLDAGMQIFVSPASSHDLKFVDPNYSQAHTISTFFQTLSSET